MENQTLLLNKGVSDGVKNLNTLSALKNEIERLKTAAELLQAIYNGFDSYYSFRDFIKSHAKVYTNEERSRIGNLLDSYFNFDDSE